MVDPVLRRETEVPAAPRPVLARESKVDFALSLLLRICRGVGGCLGRCEGIDCPWHERR